MATTVTDALRRDRFDRDISSEEVREILSAEIVKVLEPVAQPLTLDPAQKPFVILMVGVNGTGKTTTIGKLASLFHGEGKKVMLAAGDTFRAAAIEQLQVWGDRTGAPVIKKPAGSDASGLAYEAVEQARAQGTDVLLIDTAGRLQNKDELMGELEKIIRVIKKVDPTAPHATLLTLDATTGQNALNQVEIFGKRAGVTGLVMTKLDGTARGGILVAIARRFALPVHFIGVGEGVDNLEPFAARDFAQAIAGNAK
jgi:fused signal recognition particle receptor